MTHRDSNQGACTNSCRWKYQAHEAKETPEGNIISIDPKVAQPQPSDSTWPEPTMEQLENMETNIFLLQEEGRPGEYMPAYEDEHGTYIMNSKDLRAIQHIKRLYDLGVDSFKIEGRTKSHFYVARTAQLYREALDDAIAGNDFNIQLMEKLEGLANRGYTEGFYRRHLPAEYQNYENGNSKSLTQQFVGEVLEVDNDKHMMTIDVKNRFVVGDDIELMTPNGNVPFKLDHIESAKKGELMEAAPGSGHIVKIPMPIENIPDRSMLIRKLPI